MRVLHVHSGNIYGGIETLLVALSDEYRRRRDAEMHVALCFGGRLADALASNGVAVSMLGEARLSRPATVRTTRGALVLLLERLNPDVVVMHLPWAQLIFGGTVKRRGYPLVTWVHGPATGWMSRAAALHRPDAVLCNSAFIESSLPATYRAVPHPVVYYPVSPPPADARGARTNLRCELGSGDDDLVIVQVSRLDPWKGHEVHIRAAARLARSNRWALWLVGGPQRPSEAKYEAALRRMAEQLGIGDRVKFLGVRTDVWQVLAASDLYCQPNTEAEPFGLSYVEALAAGLPVIASDLGGAREIVTSDTGVLVPAGDVSAVEGALRRLIEDPMERNRLGRNGPARAAALCDPERQMTLIESVFRNCARTAA